MTGSRIERKLAAIFYADVAGYSRLTGVDEEGTHRRLSACLDLISQTVEGGGGRIVHYAGDAVLADFPSVVDAVSCAASVQRELREQNAPLPRDRRVEFRIGINLGEVMVDRNDIYGDGVNVAARLESLADAGGICVSESVFNQLGDKLDVDYEFLGRRTVKNIATPVSAYRILLDSQDRREQRKRRFWQHFRATKRVVLLAAVLLLGGAMAVGSLMMVPPETSSSVAVVPFRMIGDGGQPAAFGEGLTEDLITELTKRTDLQVVALFAEAENGEPVRYRVEGTVRIAEGRVRITTQLVGMENGFHLWGARYDRPLGDTLGIQAEVAGKIGMNLEGQLASAEAERMEAGMTTTGVMISGLAHLGRFGERAVSGVLNLYDRLLGGDGNG